MSDETLNPIPSDAMSAGQMLRAARDASGMHMANLSMTLKVPIKKLEALEADNWTLLPDRVFVRALITSVCRSIKTDPAPILAALPAVVLSVETWSREREPLQLNETFRDSNSGKFRWAVSMPMALCAIGLLVAAVVMILLPRSHTSSREIDQKVEIEPTPTFEPQSAPALLPMPASSATAPASLPTPVVTTLPVMQASAAEPTSASSVLRMMAKGVVWVEVKDAKGALLVQRTLQPKDVVNVSGQPPLAVVVGRINEMQLIEVRGKPFSLAGLSPDNVARFEVK